MCRYNVYASLEAQAAYLKLNDNGIHLMELQDAFADLQVRLEHHFFQCYGSACACFLQLSCSILCCIFLGWRHCR